MRKYEENGLMMEEIAVKNLQEITGGAAISIISQPIPRLTGLIAQPFPIPPITIPPRTTGIVAQYPINLLK